MAHAFKKTVLITWIYYLFLSDNNISIHITHNPEYYIFIFSEEIIIIILTETISNSVAFFRLSLVAHQKSSTYTSDSN